MASPARRQCAESADDPGVEEQIERFGGQHAQGRQRQLRDLGVPPACGGATARLRLGRPTHPKAALSAATTSSTEPVVE